MKNNITILRMFGSLIVFTFFVFNSSYSQVQIDHQLQLTGTGTNGAVTGIKQVADSSSAVSAKVLQTGSLVYNIDSGVANAYSINLRPATSAYTPGMVVTFMAANANSGVSTLNVNSLGAVTLKKNVSTDLASGDIIVGQIVSVIYDGVNFQVLSPLSASTGGGSSHGKQMFTSNGTFTVPSGVTTAWVTMVGGGGGGGGGNGSGTGAGGGGGASYIAYQVTLSQPSYSVTIGTLGTAGANNGGNGGNGGNSSFGSLLTANGGKGGGGGQSGATGAGGTAGTGGVAGEPGGPNSNNANYSGGGGSSVYGKGGLASYFYSNGGNGGPSSGFGSGGAAGGNAGVNGATGSAGSPGFVLVEW